MDVVLTAHATLQIQRRELKREWITDAIATPDQTETHAGKTSFFKCHKDRGRMLRVVTPEGDPGRVITAYFDRRHPC